MPALDYEPVVLAPRREAVRLTPIQEEILALKRERNAVILAHNYQIEAIQQVADYVGDSLGLSYQAQAPRPTHPLLRRSLHGGDRQDRESGPDCAVARSQRRLLPLRLLPADRLAAYKAAHPELYVVAYINCSAAVKALSDVICTSGNAQKIVQRVPADRPILFVPDQNLGQWVSQRTGRAMQLWPGSCYAHVLFTVQALEKVRQKFPGAPVVAHPECVQAVRDLADEVCSTELMVKFAKASPADTIIVVTESGMLHRLRREVPDKTFVAGPTDTCACNDCRYMKMNTIEKVRDALKTMSPAIELPEAIRSAALVPIQRMLDWSR